jgi:hypothetical protein
MNRLKTSVDAFGRTLAIKIPAKTVVKFRSSQGRKGRGFGGKEVVKELYPGEPKRLVLRRPIAGSHLHSRKRPVMN